MVHSYYIICKHTAEPCCTKTHCHGNLSHVERGEAGVTHHYHTNDGEVQVQTTVRLPGHGAAPVISTVAHPATRHAPMHGQGQPQAQLQMIPSSTSPSTQYSPSAARAYEAQAPAYEQADVHGGDYNGDLKPFTLRK